MLVALIVIMSTVQAWRAVRALDEAESLAQGLSDRIAQGDVAGARARLDAFDRATTTARKSTDGPIWWLGSKFPYVGRNIGALRTIAAASDSVSDRVLPGVVDVADQVQLETFRPRNKRVDLEAVARALPVLAEADQTLAEADARVMAIDVPRLMPLLQLRAGEAQAKFHQTAVAVAAAHDTARLLPTMLAERGPTRRYLMLVMNNAEVRSLAGMPGSMAVITARRGKVDMGQQGGILDVDPLVDEALDVKRELAAGFASTIASDIRDTTSVPDFPRAAQAAAAIVEERWDEDFDGVVAIDPVALSYVLAGLGSVDVGDGIQLNQNNAVRTLLNVVYVRYPLDPVRQDDVFELAARRSFDALVDGRGNSVRTIRGLLRGVQERRIMLWSRSEREQSLISSNGLAGALTHDRRTPEVAAFLNDAGSSKMQYYLRTSSRLQTRKCYANGVQALRLTTTLRSDAPQGVALPLSITGPGRYVGQGDMRLHLLVMGPQGGRVTALRVDGKRAPVGRNAYRGRAIARVSRVLPPGQSTVITADVQTAPGATSAAVLRTTPGVQANDDVVETRSCAS